MSVSSSSTKMVWLNRSALARRPLNFRCGGRTELLTDYCSQANSLQMLCKFERNAGRKQVVCLCPGAWFTLEARAAFKLRCPREALVNWMMLLVGLLIGVFSGVVGLGGGILFVAALIWIAGMSPHKAQGTSLGAAMGPRAGCFSLS